MHAPGSESFFTAAQAPTSEACSARLLCSVTLPLNSAAPTGPLTTTRSTTIATAANGSGPHAAARTPAPQQHQQPSAGLSTAVVDTLRQAAAEALRGSLDFSSQTPSRGGGLGGSAGAAAAAGAAAESVARVPVPVPSSLISSSAGGNNNTVNSSVGGGISGTGGAGSRGSVGAVNSAPRLPRTGRPAAEGANVSSVYTANELLVVPTPLVTLLSGPGGAGTAGTERSSSMEVHTVQNAILSPLFPEDHHGATAAAATGSGSRSRGGSSSAVGDSGGGAINAADSDTSELGSGSQLQQQRYSYSMRDHQLARKMQVGSNASAAVAVSDGQKKQGSIACYRNKQCTQVCGYLLSLQFMRALVFHY